VALLTTPGRGGIAVLEDARPNPRMWHSALHTRSALSVQTPAHAKVLLIGT
jgi:hypothetical protein